MESFEGANLGRVSHYAYVDLFMKKVGQGTSETVYEVYGGHEEVGCAIKETDLYGSSNSILVALSGRGVSPIGI